MSTVPLTVVINDINEVRDFLPCPFCGSIHLGVTNWWDDAGEFDAINCFGCKAEAPADKWNNRGE